MIKRKRLLKLIGLIAGPLLLLGGGGFGIYTHRIPVPAAVRHYLPDYHPSGAKPRATFHLSTAVTITMPAIESNLASGGHYIQVIVSFEVMPTALTTQGATLTAGSAGGTSSVLLNNRIEAALTLLARETSYGSLHTATGVAHFRQAIQQRLTTVFGPRMVGDVLLPTLLTQ